MTTAAPPRLQLAGITKQYPAVRANDGIDLVVQPGEIHAVLGENGAGKSTLMKVIYGAVQPDAGSIRWNGQPVQVQSPAAARQLGIAMVYQHFSLFDTLTAAENVWLGLDRTLTLAAVTQRITDVAQSYGLPVDPKRPVHTLGVGERQRVEIVRALLTNPRLLILDEPTSVLTPQAVQTLFATLRLLAAQGCSILYISHKLDEIRALCERCTVLRGGRVTGSVDPRLESNASLSRLMIGAEPPPLQQQRLSAPGAVLLQVRGLTLPRQHPFGVDLQGIGFDVRAGEIVGIAGVSGNGQRELMAALSGEDGRAAVGCVRLAGGALPPLPLAGEGRGEGVGKALQQQANPHPNPLPRGEGARQGAGNGLQYSAVAADRADEIGIDLAGTGPRARRRLGLRCIPEERLGRGAVPSLSLADNLLLTRAESVAPRGWVNHGRLRQLADAVIARFRVKAGGAGAAASSLSGGNLQKYIVGREVAAAPRVLLVSQPTWGVDVGAAAQIRGELLALRDAGCALLVVSEELDELFQLSDRLLVMAGGRLSPSVATPDASIERIGVWMSGLWDAPAGAAAAVVHATATASTPTGLPDPRNKAPT